MGSIGSHLVPVPSPKHQKNSMWKIQNFIPSKKTGENYNGLKMLKTIENSLFLISKLIF